MSNKICGCCSKSKNKIEFSNNKNTSDGLAYYCKICHNTNSKIRRDSNPNKIKIESRSNKHRFSVAVSRSKKRKIIWDLTIDQWIGLVINKTCHYCGGYLPETGTGLDRKDSNIGYILQNVVPCCTACNRIKSMYVTYEEMLEVAKLLKGMRAKSITHNIDQSKMPDHP